MSEKQLPAAWKDTAPQQFLTLGHSQAEWETLTKHLYPAAKNPNVIMLAAKICAAQKLPLLKKPLHIVPVYNSSTGQYEDGIWPGIALYEIEAHRTAEFAGKDRPIWGPEKKFHFAGVEIVAPEWCIQTVYRFGKNGEKCAFTTDEIYLIEWIQKLKADGKAGKKGQPQGLWGSKPRYMLGKCALAVALRMAFPEQVGAQPTAEEMEGAEVDHSYVDVEWKDSEPPKSPPKQRTQRAATTARHADSAGEGSTGCGAGEVTDVEITNAADVNEPPPAQPSPDDRLATDEERKKLIEDYKAIGWKSGQIVVTICKQFGLDTSKVKEQVTVRHLEWFKVTVGALTPEEWQASQGGATNG